MTDRRNCGLATVLVSCSRAKWAWAARLSALSCQTTFSRLQNSLHRLQSMATRDEDFFFSSESIFYSIQIPLRQSIRQLQFGSPVNYSDTVRRPSDRDINWRPPVQGQSPPVQVKDPHTISIRRNISIGIPLNLCIPTEMGYIQPLVENENSAKLRNCYSILC